MYLIAVITGISLIGSFLCSLMEAALYSMPRSRIESLKRDGDPGGIRLSKLRDKIDEPIAAILTLNTAVNVLGASWAGALVSNYYGDAWLGLFSAGFTAGVLFFSEIIPKSLGVTYANVLAPKLSSFIQLLVTVLMPFVKASGYITRLWGKNSHLNMPTEEDIISLTRLSNHGGEILKQEAKWVSNALKLDDVYVEDIMTPKNVVCTLEENTTLDQIDLDSDHWRYSRIPVFSKEDENKIVGIVRRQDIFQNLLRGEKDQRIHNLMIAPDFVPTNMLLHDLLDRFLITRRHLFCVENKNEQYVGVVALEDVLEFLIGDEIVDELDLHEDMQKYSKTQKED
ncbi:MAG TPA: CNNM domain-containing protein [Thermodesulfobacteriota bacterium]|nr:CNNM domain-containing protein [Thermodesulfobacteriota bacterium]